MSLATKSIIINGRVSVRFPANASREVRSLQVRKTDVIRVRSTREVSVSLLEPSEGDVLMFGSVTAALNVATLGGSFVVEQEVPIATSSPSLRIGSSDPCDIYVAVVPALELEDIGVERFEIDHTITRLPSNSDLLIPYIRALDNFFDRTAAPRVTLNPWSADLIFLMGRGILNVTKSRFGESGASLVARARAMISENYHDPAMNPPRIAALLGVPLRTLQRRFAEEGSSVTGEIRKMRVQAAKEFLAQVPHSRSSVSAAAREAGFGSTVSLRRALRGADEAANAQPSGLKHVGSD